MSVGTKMQERAELFRKRYAAVRQQIGRVIVGHDEVVHGVLTCLFVGGHTLLEGVPGLGKTLLARWFASSGHGEAIDGADRWDETALFHRWNRAQEDGRPLLRVGVGQGGDSFVLETLVADGELQGQRHRDRKNDRVRAPRRADREGNHHADHGQNQGEGPGGDPLSRAEEERRRP